MVGCSRCTYPSIHLFVSRSRSVARRGHIQAVTFLLTKTLSRSRSVVWCLVWCVWCVVLVVCGVCVCVCVVLLWWCVCVVCGEAWHTLSLSLSCSLSFLFPFPFAFPFFFSLLFLFPSPSPPSPLLLFLLLLLVLLLMLLLVLLLLFFLFLFSLLFSPTNTMERTDQPTRRPTSRHLNVIWRRASAQQSVLSLLLSLPSLLPSPPPLLKKKKEGTFNYKNISGDDFFLLQF